MYKAVSPNEAPKYIKKSVRLAKCGIECMSGPWVRVRIDSMACDDPSSDAVQKETIHLPQLTNDGLGGDLACRSCGQVGGLEDQQNPRQTGPKTEGV